MAAYEKFHNGEMRDFIPTDAQLAESFASLPQVRVSTTERTYTTAARRVKFQQSRTKEIGSWV